MENFDAALTDRRLTRNLVERHLAASAAEPSLLLGEYVCLLSGGSSGRRGLMVQTVSEYAEFVATINRRALAEAMTPAGLPPEGLVIGIVGAGTPVHSSGLGATVAVAPPVRMIPAPASLPTAEIVRRLNAARPPALLAYAAKLAELAREQRAGRLRLNLRSVTSMAEMLSPAERTAIGEAFGVPVIDLFVSTEGLVGRSEPGSPVLTFASDTCIAECVDEDGRPVADGVASAKVLLTNLHNLTQPLIRYELTDRFTPVGSVVGSTSRRFHRTGNPKSGPTTCSATRRQCAPVRDRHPAAPRPRSRNSRSGARPTRRRSRRGRRRRPGRRTALTRVHRRTGRVPPVACPARGSPTTPGRGA